MKKNGFISTSLIYTFFILFLLLMIFLLNSYSSTRFLLEQYKYDIKNSFVESSGADINLHILVWDPFSQEYEIEEEAPNFGYYFEGSPVSYCRNGASINYVDNNILIAAQGKDSCYAYFRDIEKDIILKIYTKESESSNRVEVAKVPNYNYDLTSANCTNGASIEFDEDTRKFTVSATSKTECEVEFTKRELDIVLNIYKEDVYGTHDYNGKIYKKVNDIPGINYEYTAFNCTNADIDTEISWDEENKEFTIETAGKNECNVYFDGIISKVDLLIMQESDEGVSGYTTGKKYSKTTTTPGTGYKYVGYICDNSNAYVNYADGVLSAEITANAQATCHAYFNKYSGSVYVNYYLEKSSGDYENVSAIPSIGYKYNSSKSSCKNGSSITVNNNIVMVDSTIEDECEVYFDMVNADIKVNVYVMNRETLKYELSSVPVVGYELYNAGCTNGAVMEYINGALKVTTEGPTVCSVYFR